MLQEGVAFRSAEIAEAAGRTPEQVALLIAMRDINNIWQSCGLRPWKDDGPKDRHRAGGCVPRLRRERQGRRCRRQGFFCGVWSPTPEFSYEVRARAQDQG